MEKDRKKRIGLAAIVLTALLSCLAIGATGARYYSETKGTGSVGIAKFEIKLVEVQNPTTEMSFNSSGECVTTETLGYTFSFTSSSDVALDYSVKFTFTTPLPANVRLWIDDKEEDAISGNGTDTVYTFSGFECAIGESTKTHTLSVAVDYVENDKLIDFTTFNSSVSVDIIVEQKMPTT